MYVKSAIFTVPSGSVGQVSLTPALRNLYPFLGVAFPFSEYNLSVLTTMNGVEMVYVKRICLGIVYLSLMASGCRPPVITERNIDQYDYIVAAADNRFSLTMPQLYDLISHSQLVPRGGTLDAEGVKAFLDSILCDTLAGFKASELEFDQYYEYHRTYRQRYHHFLARRYFEEVVYSKISTDSQEVVDFYWSRPDLFTAEEQVLLHQILISPIGLKDGPDSLYYRSLTTEQLDRETAEYAYQIRKLLDLGEPFFQVALKYSHDRTQATGGGLVGWTKRGIYLDPFDSVAFSMKPGGISQPYRDETGWHILYIEDYLPEGIPPLDEQVFEVAKKSLETDKANKLGLPLLDSLSQQRRLVFNEELLDTNVYLVERTAWAAIVNEQDTIDFYEMSTVEERFRKMYRVPNTTPEMKKEMLHLLAEKYVVVQAARALGIDTLPEVVAQKASLRQKYAKQVVLQDRSDPGWIPPDNLIEKYYNEHINEYLVEKPLKVQHIITEDSVFGEFLRDQAMAGVDLIELAKEYYPGEPSIRADLANLGDISSKDVPSEFYQAALLTPVGEVSHPVKTQYGYHIIKVLRRTDSVRVDHVRSKIVSISKRDHAAEVFHKYRDELYARYNVRFPGKICPIHLKPLDYRTE